MKFKILKNLAEISKNNSPLCAKIVYQEYFNYALVEYKNKEDRLEGFSREEIAHMVAINAVKTFIN